MERRLTVHVPNDFSTLKIVDICSKGRRTSKGKGKLKKLDSSTCEDMLQDNDASSPIKHLVAKKFASIVPKRNVQVPQIVTKVKVIKLLRKASRPKSSSSYRHVDAKCQFNSQEKTTLEMLIPPSENYHGMNNPFSSQVKGMCAIMSSKPGSTDFNVNNQRNYRKDKSKKVCVKGRMKMENGSMRYLAESQLPFSDKSTESSFIDEHMLVNNDDSAPDVDMLESNDDERLFERNSNIQEQINTQVADHFLCDHCPAMFNSHQSFEKHVKTNCGEPPEKVLLDESPTLLKSISDYEKHEESLLGEKLMKQYLCDNCPTFFNSVDSLSMHMESHTKDVLMAQTLCDQYPTLWYSTEKLKSHCDQMHTPDSRETHCDRMRTPNFSSNCDQMYLPNSSDRPGSRNLENGKTLEDGIPVETTEKVSCGLCSKSFKNESFLMIHDKCTPRFLCNICQRCFYDKRGLNLHKLVHSRKKTYRKSNRILAKKLDSGETDGRILYSKTSTYKYQKDISEYYNKDEKLICAKSSKKYRKCVTSWSGKEKNCKKTRMEVKMEKLDFVKNNKKSSRRTSELNQIGKQDIPDESFTIEVIELSSDNEEKLIQLDD